VVSDPIQTGFHFAQINIARARAPLTDPLLADFFAKFDEINALADGSPGFVWRLQTETGDATDIEVGGDPRLIVNMSVWESPDALFDYVYKSGHLRVLSRRTDWFERLETPSVALWWIPVRTLPTVEDGLERLDQLARHGPTERAFTFKTRFPAPTGLADRVTAESR
jgi:hypothetical protein